MDKKFTTMKIKGSTIFVDSEWTGKILKELLSVENVSLDGKIFLGHFGQVFYKDIWFWFSVWEEDRTVEFDYIYEATPALRPSLKNKVAAKRFAQELNLRSPLKWDVSKNAFTHELRVSVRHKFSNKPVSDIITALIGFLDYVQSQKPLLDKFATERSNKHA